MEFICLIAFVIWWPHIRQSQWLFMQLTYVVESAIAMVARFSQWNQPLWWRKAAWPRKYNWAIPDSKVYGANMGPIWALQDPGGPRVGPMYFAIWDVYEHVGAADRPLFKPMVAQFTSEYMRHSSSL